MGISKAAGNTAVRDPISGDKTNVGTKVDGTTKALHVIAELDDASQSVSSPFEFRVQRGDFPLLSIKSLFGHNGAVKTTVEGIWHQGGAFIFPPTAAPLDIQSTSANDVNTTGTGARTIRITGLDTNWDVLIEDIALNGLTTVTTTGSFLRINEAVVTSAGTSGYNEGDITFDISATTYETIGATHSLLHSTKYSVPNNFNAYILRGSFATDNGSKGVSITAPARDGVTGIKYSTFPIRLVNSFEFNPAYFGKINSKNDFWVEANTISGAGTVEMSASFAILLEDVS